MSQKQEKSNHLITENSPYLLQHAHNPVDWYPWGEEALAKAKEENKMLIISVGYAACHWCHVMEHESYEDKQVAAIMNEHFISIKVDREERPDIDDIYMTACHLSSNRSCGWPLNAFALPDGRPVWAGTYFPKEQWMNILHQFKTYYTEEPKKLYDAANNIMNGIKQMDQVILNPDKEKISQNSLDRLVKKMLDQIDPVKGGRAGQPKFPLPNNYQFLLKHYDLNNDPETLDKIRLTLDNMAFGGIYDHVGGGFARYSVDKDWFLPHFEKMLYDNAQLISLYAQTYRLDQKPLYKQVIEKSMSFIERELKAPKGGFYSSLDADSEGIEGKFYVWTHDEIEGIINDMEEFDIFKEFYGIEKRGNWEHRNNILFQREERSDFASRNKLSPDSLDRNLDDNLDKLLEARANRIRPGLDDKILSSWNGLMITGAVDAYKALQVPQYKELALNQAEFLLAEIIEKDGRMTRSYKNGERKINAFLDDYAHVIQAFIAVYEISFDIKWLKKAELLMEYALLHFYEEGSARFYFTSDLDPALVTRRTENTDNVIPGSVSGMARNLYSLSKYLGRKNYEQISFNLFDKNVPELNRIAEAAYFSNWLSLAQDILSPPTEIVIMGPDCEQFRDEINHQLFSNHLILGHEVSEVLPLMKDKLQKNKTMVFVCQDNVCKNPVDNVKDAIKELESFKMSSID